MKSPRPDDRFASSVSEWRIDNLTHVRQDRKGKQPLQGGLILEMAVTQRRTIQKWLLRLAAARHIAARRSNHIPFLPLATLDDQRFQNEVALANAAEWIDSAREQT